MAMITEASQVLMTTPRELLGVDNEQLEMIGLMDCDMMISSVAHEDGTTYSVELDTPPQEVDQFTQFLNTVAPSDVAQYPFGIKADWEVALDPYDRLHKLHARLGESWDEFVLHAPSMIDMMDSKVEFWGHASRIGDYDKWLADLPKPVRLNPNWCRMAVTMGTRRLLKELGDKGLENSDVVLDALLQNAMEWKRDFSEQTPEWKKAHADLRNSMDTLELPDRIEAFAKLPSSYRRWGQGNLMRFFTHEDSYVPLFLQHGRFWSRYVLHPSYSVQGVPDSTDIIDKNGQKAVVVSSKLSWARIPRDYRELAKAKRRQIMHENGRYLAEAIIVDMGFAYSGGKRATEKFVDYDTVRQISGVAVSPLIEWTDVRTPAGFRRTSWNLEVTAHDHMRGELPYTTYRSGLVGLIAVAGFSPDVVGHRNWRATNKLPARQGDTQEQMDREQQMGAAQLPLLALMVKQRLSNGFFTNKVREALTA